MKLSEDNQAKMKQLRQLLRERDLTPSQLNALIKAVAKETGTSVKYVREVVKYSTLVG